MKENERIPTDKQQKYILLGTEITNGTNYEKLYGWKPGTILRRISIWYGSNGLSRYIKQAYFVPENSNSNYGQIAWSDHVEEITGQLKLDI